MGQYRMLTEYKRIPRQEGGSLKLLILRPGKTSGPVPGILWIHGGGYTTGFAGLALLSCGAMLARRYGAVMLAPDYRLAGRAPYPAALNDCYAALRYLYRHGEALGVDPDRLVVGGESAGGGLAAALCILARDLGEIPVRLQLPLYPMLDCRDTASSRDNHGLIWDTRRNHRGWSRYLGALYGSGEVPGYASAARETNYQGLPPAFTFVSEGEPFLDEALTYTEQLREAGVPARANVYPGSTHAFDLLMPWLPVSKRARQAVCQAYETYVPSRKPETGATGKEQRQNTEREIV